MKRKKMAVIALGLTITLAPAPAIWGQVASSEAKEASKDRFAALDTNRDGKLSAEEMLAQRRVMWARGATGDALNLDACLRVFGESLTAAGGEFGDQMSRSFSNECKRMDKNNNGSLSWEEFAGPVWLGFKLMDSDGDGFLTLDEFAGQGLQALRRLPPPPQLSAQVKAELDENIAKASAARSANSANSSDARRSALPAPQVLSTQRAPVQPAAEPGRGSDSIYERVQGWFR